MDVLDSHTDPDALFRLCEPGLGYLFRGELGYLAEQYSYAVANEREPRLAIQEDLALALPQGDSLKGPDHVEFQVKYFNLNDIPVFAVVECFLETQLGNEVLAEFVVIGSERKFLSLEQISPVTPDET